MNIEKGIVEIISKKLNDGLVEKLVEEHLEKSISNSLNNLFNPYGEITKHIEDQIKSVMIPYIESYDYSQYITKLDDVLVDVLKETTLDNRTILKNFKNLMSPIVPKDGVLLLSDLYEEWMNSVSSHVDVDGLEIDYDGYEPSYAHVDVTMNITHDEGRRWMSSKRATILLECDHDESLNVAIPVYRFKDIHEENHWVIDYKSTNNLNTLRHLSDFEIYLMNVKQSVSHIVLDTDNQTNEILPDKSPEVYYS